MSKTETSLNDEELVEEVRNAMAGLDATKIPDDTIIQSNERFVEPLLNEIIPSNNVDQDHFDNATVAYTAEKSFDAWLALERLRDGEIETFTRPEKYKEKLKERTNNALFVVDAARPPDTPNTVVTVKHDGKNRRVIL